MTLRRVPLIIAIPFGLYLLFSCAYWFGCKAMADTGSGASPALALPAADPGPITIPHAVADPVSKALTVTDGGWDLVEAYGPIWGAMLLLYGLAGAFVKRNASEHWISEGRRLAMLTAALGIAGSLLQVKFGGASWAGMIFSALGAMKLMMSPTLKPAGA